MALGMIEVYGYLAAVEALDAAVKSANVKLLQTKKSTGGLVAVMVTGDVGAVKAAMDSAAAAAEKVGTVLSVHVIPRPASGVEEMITGDGDIKAFNDSNDSNDSEEPKESTVNEKEGLSQQSEIKLPEECNMPENQLAEEVNNISEEKLQEEASEVKIDKNDITPEKLREMTAGKLRHIAYSIGITNMNRQEIKNAKKDELIDKISNFLEQESV